jgi:hypothetical protein
MNYWADNSITRWVAADLQRQATWSPSPSAMYRLLEMYYYNNGLYDAIRQELYEASIWTPAMKGLRNPAHRVVEFYPAKIWPGTLPDALPILTENPAIIEPIQQGWTWSNWGAKKQLAARWFALYGDWFVKVATHSNDEGKVDRVYLQQIKPEYVTDFTLDERGFVTAIRLDIPQADNAGTYTHTEVWDKTSGMVAIWRNSQGASATTKQLGVAKESHELSEYGIDFVPFVHAMFQDVGDDRGVGAFVHSLDKIDETNRQATRLHQMIFRFNKPLLAVMANDKDPQGRPLPAPKVGDTTTGKLTTGDDDLITLPGMSKLDAMVPAINYDAHLKAITEQMAEIEKDQPELKYYRLMDLGGNISGRAVRLLLSDASDKALEARGNMESALVRANQMMLTIGVNAGLFSASIGKYESGSFDHSFAPRDVFPLSDQDIAEAVKNDVGAGIPLTTALRRRGWSQADLDQMVKDRQTEAAQQQSSLGQSILAGLREMNQGTGGISG